MHITPNERQEPTAIQYKVYREEIPLKIPVDLQYPHNCVQQFILKGNLCIILREV